MLPKKIFIYFNKCTHLYVGPALTLIVPDLQVGWRVLGVVSEDDREAVYMFVLATQVQRCLSITVQCSRVRSCIQQNVHQNRLIGDYSQVQWCLREKEFTDSVNQIHSIFKNQLYLERMITLVACQYLSSVSQKSFTLMSDKVFRFIWANRLSHILVWIPVTVAANLELV